MATTKPDAYSMVDFTDVYANTTASSANVLVTSGGVLQRATSSMKYKRDVEPIPPEKVDELIAVMADAAIWYRSRCAADNPEWGYYGLSAESLAGPAPQFVHFRPLPGGGLEPEGVMYERAVVPLLLKVRELEKRLAMVETGQAGAAPIIERVDVPGPERIVEVEKPVEVIREVERIVTVEDTAALEAALAERDAALAKLAEVEGAGVLPPPEARMAPDWLEVREGESIADAASRFTKELKAELSNLTNRRLDGQRVDEARIAQLNDMIETLVKLGGGG